MPRPRKADGEKLVQVSTGLPPDRFDFLDREAKRRRISLAELLRSLLMSRVSQMKYDSATRLS